MSVAFENEQTPTGTFDPVAIARSLSRQFEERAGTADDHDTFVRQNFEDLKTAGLVDAGVPTEFGGGGADIRQLCMMLKELGHCCGSTALAFAMHTHQVAIPAWRWTHQNAAPVVPLLKRIAAEKLFLLSSGGSDWIDGSGTAEKVDGGYKISARKVFTSGSPLGDLLMTGAVLDDGDNGKFVLHFGIPMKSPKVTVLDNWRTMGMRGTGSNDVLIDGHVVAEEAVALKRKSGEWHMLFHIISMVAFPIIYSAYLGIAESARDLAIAQAKKRPANHHQIELAGRMETELRAAQYALDVMISIAEQGQPSYASTSETMIARNLVGRHAIEAVTLAMELAGGSSFYRANGLERRFRDIQGARFHAMRPGQQQEYTGRLALGLDVTNTY